MPVIVNTHRNIFIESFIATCSPNLSICQCAMAACFDHLLLGVVINVAPAMAARGASVSSLSIGRTWPKRSQKRDRIMALTLFFFSLLN